MFILLLFICAVPIASLTVPSIEVDRSDVFNSKMHEFERRRLYVDIVDTVSYPPTTDTSTANIGFKRFSSNEPLVTDKYVADFELAKRKIPELLGCTEITDLDVTRASHDAYAGTFPFSPDQITSDAEKDSLLQRIVQGSGAEERYSNVRREGCVFRVINETTSDSEWVLFQFKYTGGPQIRSGWIVERYPFGEFYYSRHESTMNYKYDNLRTNYSYIDGISGEIFDVSPVTNDFRKRTWAVTSNKMFEIKKTSLFLQTPSIPEFLNIVNVTTFYRETETGILVATLSKGLHIFHKYPGKFVFEVIDLDGNFFHIKCYPRKNEPLKMREARENVQDYVILGNPDGVDFKFDPLREGFLDLPEITELEQKIVHSSGRALPSSKHQVHEEIIMPTPRDGCCLDDIMTPRYPETPIYHPNAPEHTETATPTTNPPIGNEGSGEVETAPEQEQQAPTAVAQTSET